MDCTEWAGMDNTDEQKCMFIIASSAAAVAAAAHSPVDPSIQSFLGIAQSDDITLCAIPLLIAPLGSVQFGLRLLFASCNP